MELLLIQILRTPRISPFVLPGVIIHATTSKAQGYASCVVFARQGFACFGEFVYLSVLKTELSDRAIDKGLYATVQIW